MRQISGTRLNRRQALVAAAAAITALSVPGTASAALHYDTRLLEMGRELDRLRRRIARLHRGVRAMSVAADRVCHERGVDAQLPDGRRSPAIDLVRAEVGYDRAWQSWSSAVDRSVDLAVSIRRMPGTGVPVMSVKFDALIWELFHDDLAVGLEDTQLRRLKRFGRELRHLAAA